MDQEQEAKMMEAALAKQAAEPQHGTVNYTVGRTKDVVVLEFNTTVKWLALSAQGARNLAADLRKMAAQLDKQIGTKAQQQHRPPPRKPPSQPGDFSSKRRRNRPRPRSK